MGTKHRVHFEPVGIEIEVDESLPRRPAPMVDAALSVLGGKGVEADKIYYDKFTGSGKIEEAKEESGPEQAEEASR